MHDDLDDALQKEVPGQIFQFEEKIFGMSLTQLLSDAGAGTLLFSLTASMSLVPRIILCLLLALPILVLVHGKAGDQTLLQWIFLLVRARFVPRHTIWSSLHQEGSTGEQTDLPSVQSTWLRLDTLTRGLAGWFPQGGKKLSGTAWAILECEGRNISYLPMVDQVRLYRRFESFLAGLEFRLQFLTQVEQIQADLFAPLVAQKQALARLRNNPRLAALQAQQIRYQESQVQTCTIARHFIAVSVTGAEEAAKRLEGTRRGPLSFLWRLFSHPAQEPLSQDFLLGQLRIRLSVVTKMLQQLDIRSWILDDPEFLRTFAASIAPGASIPSFHPQTVQEQEGAKSALTSGQSRSTGLFQRAIHGFHGTFLYHSLLPQPRFEVEKIHPVDLLAPSAVAISPDDLELTLQRARRYQRYFALSDYGHHLRAGWVSELTGLGLPMLMSTIYDPIDSFFMTKRLEMHLVKLESQKLADQKSLRITRAHQYVEAEQIRHLVKELAAQRLKIFATQTTIGISAGSRARLEERTRYLFSHLRDMQLKVKRARYRQELLWQKSFPVCPPIELDLMKNLPSDVLSTFLHCSSGVIGTPTGVFLGWTGSGMTRRPVFFNPWDERKRLANPHMVIIGESGMGKSFTGKTLVSGLMGMGIADVVILDRDDDYLPLHHYLGNESQRYNLARGCPINFFDLPYSPSDIDPDDPTDLLSEFLDNHLIPGLSLLVCDANTLLSRSEEAYLMSMARTAYEEAGITSESLYSNPDLLLGCMPTLDELISIMERAQQSERAQALSRNMRQSLIDRLKSVAHLFSGQTSAALDKPLTIFSIHDLDDKWYAFMTFVVQNFLMRHRSLRRDERYLAYVVEEASYMLRHPAGRRYLETGSRGFRKLGIAQFTLSQHPREFLEEGQVVLSNAGAAIYLGMQPNAAAKLQLSSELERIITAAVPGMAVIRCGNEFAALTIAASTAHRALFTTDPVERKNLQMRRRERAQKMHIASPGEAMERKEAHHATPSIT